MRKLIICLITVMSITFSSIPIYAESNKSIYILSAPVDHEYVDEIDKLANDIIASHIRSDSKYRCYAGSKIELGNPFTISTEMNSYYFPVIVDNVIRFTINVYKNDGESDLCWTCSEYLSDGLRSLSDITSRNEPAVLNKSGSEIVASVGNKELVIEYLPYNTAEPIFSNNNATDNSNLIITDIADPRSEININRTTYNTGYWYLGLDMQDLQTDQNWCSAFCGAQIMRFMGYGHVYAVNIMTYYYGGIPDLKNRSIARSELIQYANLMGSYPTEINNTLSASSITGQINAGKPIYMSCECDTNTHIWHAMVIRGYSSYGQNISIWNPWWDYCFSVSNKGQSIKLDSRSFTWKGTLYNW